MRLHAERDPLASWLFVEEQLPAVHFASKAVAGSIGETVRLVLPLLSFQSFSISRYSFGQPNSCVVGLLDLEVGSACGKECNERNLGGLHFINISAYQIGCRRSHSARSRQFLPHRLFAKEAPRTS